jgi:hypothetical protein
VTYSFVKPTAYFAALLSSSALALCATSAHAGDLLNGWNNSSSVTLRGGIEHKDGKNEHFIVVVPEVEFTRSEDDFNAGLRLSTEIDQHSTHQVAPRKLGIEGEIGVQLSTNAGIEAQFGYDLSQARPSVPDTPSDVAQEGHVQSLNAGAAYTQRLGKSTFVLRGGFARVQNGNDLRGDGSYRDNGERNYWQSGVGGRVSYQFTPRVAAFVDAQLSRQQYDVASLSLLAKRDNWQSELRAGVDYAFNEQISAEVSAGVLRQDFDAASIDDLQTYVYDAAIDWRPWETASVTLSYGTEVGPTARLSEVMEITDTARVSFTQQVNNNWAANAYASIARQQYRETSTEVKKSGAGFGVTYRANAELSAFANYGFELTEETAKAPEKVHKIEAGFRFTRP